MNSRLEKTLTALLSFSALVISGIVMHQTFFVGARARMPPASQPEFIESWEDLRSIGIPVLGVPNAPVKLVTILDPECSVCADFFPAVREMVEENTNEVEWFVVNHPLKYHRFSLPASRAAECALDLDAFVPWMQAVFDKQDSLGLRSWGAYAADAGIPDSSLIHDCAVNPSSVERLDAALEFGDRISLHGTPTVILNGWRYPQTPSIEALKAAVDSALVGKEGLALGLR